MNLRVLITVLGLSFLYTGSAQNMGNAQNPYEVEWGQDASVIGLSVLGQLAAIYRYTNNDPLTEAQIGLLDKNDINSFDRIATGYNSSGARLTSDILLYSSFTTPFLYLANKRTRKGFLQIGVMATEVFLLNGVTTSFAKELVLRTRPYVYNPDRGLDEKTSLHARISFYSGHTSVAASFSFFSAKVFSDYYPDSKWKPVVWTAAALWPAVTGFSRVAAGEHFPTDVITGYIAGGLIGYFVPHFHKKKEKTDKVGFSVYPGINSIGLTMTW